MGKPIILYPNGIKGANKLPASDLRQIAAFNRIVMNSIRMDRLMKKYRIQP